MAEGADNPFVTVPASAALTIPLAGLPVTAGLAVFLITALAALGLAAALTWRHYLRGLTPLIAAGLIASGFGNLPATTSLANAQWAPFITLAAVGAMLLATRRPALAGFVLGFALIKPQLIWLLPVALIIAAEWRMLAGLAGGGAAWLLASVLAAGPHSLADWVGAAVARRAVAQTQNGGVPGIVTLAGLNGVWPLVVMALLGVLATAALWRHREVLRARPDIAVAAGIAVSVASVAYLWTYDLTVLAPALVVLCTARPLLALVLAFALDLAAAADLLAGHGNHIVPAVLLIVVVVLLLRLSNHTGADATPASGVPSAIR